MRQCIDAVESRRRIPNYDYHHWTTTRRKEATLDFFATTKYRVVPCPGVFNYGAHRQSGVAHSLADYVVTLNNDTVLDTPDWLERMVAGLST